MSFRAITDRQVEWVQSQIQLESYVRTRGYKYFKANGLIKPAGPGNKEVIDTVLSKMKPGQISFGTESLPESVMRLDQITGKIAIIGTIVAMSKTDLDAWKNNTSRIGGSYAGGPMGLAIAEQIQEFYDYVDKFIFYGDDISGPLDNDDWVGAGDFTGLMNGFTAFAGGAGSDNNITAAGDFQTTADTAVDHLKKSGWDSDQYVIFSDTKPWKDAAKGNNFYSTAGILERDQIIAREDIGSWQASVNAIDNAGTAYRMAFTSPESGKGAKKRQKRTKPYCLYEGYKFNVFPLYGGGLDKQLNYNVALLWSGRIQELHATSLWRTGTLT